MKVYMILFFLFLLVGCSEQKNYNHQEWNVKFDECVDYRINSQGFSDRKAEEYCERYTK